MEKTVLLLIGLLAAQASVAARCRVTGRVVDGGEDGLPLPAATVAAYSGDDKPAGDALTDADGRFVIALDGEGSYVLRFTYVGYEEAAFRLDNPKGDIDAGEISLMPSATALRGVEVTGVATVRKIDRYMVSPTEAQRRASTNGVSLLQRMQIGDLEVNPIDKTVKNGYGDAAQLRINGVPANVEEVVALRPAEVTRVEYHDNPGLRYGGAAAVVDFIVKRRDAGGNVNGDLTGFMIPYIGADGTLAAKYGAGRSTVGFSGWWSRRDAEWIRSNTETYVYPDRVASNEEIGLPTKVKYDNLNLSLSYNYTADKGTLNIALRNQYNDTPNDMSDRNSVLYQDGAAYTVKNRLRTKSVIPSLDIYGQLNLKEGKKLYVDVVGTYQDNSSSQTYSMAAEVTRPSLIESGIEGDKYSLIGEAIYEQGLWGGTLTAGLKHTQSWTDNRYVGTVTADVSMTAAETYAFAEFRASAGRLDYSVGAGAMRTYNRQGGAGREDWTFRPTLSLSFRATDRLFFRYKADMSSYSPSLSDLNDVEQSIDVYQVRRGNPALRSVKYVSNVLTASWQSSYVDVSVSGRYSYDFKPMMEETLYEDGRFVRTVDNQKGFHRLNLSASAVVRPWKDYLSLRLSPYFFRYISEGNDYVHTHSNFGVRGSLMATYKNWMLMAEVYTSHHNLWGETLEKGEKIHTIAVGYNREKWSVSMLVMNPFSKKYDQERENRSALATKREYIYSDDFNAMLALNVTFNLDFGKQRRDSGKRINNSDTDTGILQGK